MNYTLVIGTEMTNFIEEFCQSSSMQKTSHIVDSSETKFSFDTQQRFSTLMICSGKSFHNSDQILILSVEILLSVSVRNSDIGIQQQQ